MKVSFDPLVEWIRNVGWEILDTEDRYGPPEVGFALRRRGR
jgi:hypothetical protein